MLEEAKRLVEEAGPLGYVVLALAAFVEYVVPFFPGDALTLFGVFLAVVVGHPAGVVYVVTIAGASTGGVAVWSFGRWLDRRHDRWPRFLRGPRADAALASIRAGYARYGAFYLVINRFVPAFRAFFFIAAGLAGVPLRAVLLWGTVSAMAWYGLLLFIGWTVARSYDELVRWTQQYTVASLAVVVAIVAAYVLARRLRRRKGRVE